MAGPFTVVVLVDDDGDEFPIRLPGVYRSNLGADVAAALQIADSPEYDGLEPRGPLTFDRVEYVE